MLLKAHLAQAMFSANTLSCLFSRSRFMRNAVKLLLGSLLIAGAGSGAGAAPRLDPEAKLAEALSGRTAGAPVDCLNLRDIRSSRIIERTAILYETNGGTIYVNRPDAGRESLNDWDVLVTRTSMNRLCSIDVVDLYDSSARMRTGAVFLGEFVPYRKPGRR
jgi:hypothetical protein